MLANSSKYAIRSVIYLAENSNEDNKLSSKKIANDIDVPAPFLAKIFQQLSKKKLISSTKGPNGGFYLTEKNLSNSVLDIIICIEGLEKFNSCFLALDVCNEDNPCVAHALFAPFKENLIKEFGEKNIKTFVKKPI